MGSWNAWKVKIKRAQGSKGASGCWRSASLEVGGRRSITSFSLQSTNQRFNQFNQTRFNPDTEPDDHYHLNLQNDPANDYIGKTANITVLQIEWEIITGARFL